MDYEKNKGESAPLSPIDREPRARPAFVNYGLYQAILRETQEKAPPHVRSRFGGIRFEVSNPDERMLHDKDVELALDEVLEAQAAYYCGRETNDQSLKDSEAKLSALVGEYHGMIISDMIYHELDKTIKRITTRWAAR